MEEPHLEVVMTRFMESWDDILLFDSLVRLQSGSYEILVYNKGDDVPENLVLPNHIRVMQCPNIGREAFTIFHYIYTNYYMLPDIVMFIPASWNNGNVKRGFLANILYQFKQQPIASLENVGWEQVRDNVFDSWHGSTPANIVHVKSQPYKTHALRPFSKWYEERIGKPWPGKMTFCGMFSVHKHRILKNKREQYLAWLEEIEEYGVNSEIGHYWERAMASLFLD
jgi:hypothetical protein